MPRLGFKSYAREAGGNAARIRRFLFAVTRMKGSSLICLVVTACAALGSPACQNWKSIAEVSSPDGSLGEDDSASDGATRTDGILDSESVGDSVNPVCDGLSRAPGEAIRTVQVDDTERSYVLYIPDGYTGSAPVPLIVDYHRVGVSGARELLESPYPSVTDADGVVMAFPDGLPGPSGTAWNIGPCCVDDVDDVAFAREIVRDAAAIACIDTSRVYAVGLSMGGGMAHHLACRAADLFAAVAPAAFDLIEETVDACLPPRPITVVSFRGTADPLVPYNGGYSNVVPDHPITFLGAVGTMEKWAEINGCTGLAADLGNGCQGYTASQCEGGVQVILCTKQGGGIEAGDATVAWPILKQYSIL